MKKTLLLILGFYLLILFQISFLPFFSIFGTVPNLVLLSAILVNVFEKPDRKSGIVAAGFAGLFLDIFSANPIGLFTTILIVLALAIKMLVKKQFDLQINPFSQNG